MKVVIASDSDETIQTVAPEAVWIASRSLSSGARSRDPFARNDDVVQHFAGVIGARGTLASLPR
jgi:hypothetical protein